MVLTFKSKEDSEQTMMSALTASLCLAEVGLGPDAPRDTTAAAQAGPGGAGVVVSRSNSRDVYQQGLGVCPPALLDGYRPAPWKALFSPDGSVLAALVNPSLELCLLYVLSYLHYFKELV